MPDLLEALTADCPKRGSFSAYDRCRAVYERRGVMGHSLIGQANTSEGTGKQMEWYELKGHPTDAALPPLQAASEEAALGTFARELNLKLDFAEEGETGEYVLTNTSTWKEWWVVISG